MGIGFAFGQQAAGEHFGKGRLAETQFAQQGAKGRVFRVHHPIFKVGEGIDLFADFPVNGGGGFQWKQTIIF